MNNVKFEFYKGRTYTRDFTIVGYTDKVDEMYFTASENTTDKNNCIRKTLSNGGITVVDTGITDDGEVYTTYNLLIDATDTDHMKENTEYGFDVVLKSGQ